MTSPFSKFVDRSRAAPAAGAAHAHAAAVIAAVNEQPTADTATIEATPVVEALPVAVEANQASTTEVAGTDAGGTSTDSVAPDAPTEEKPVDVSTFPALADVAIILGARLGPVSKMIAGTLGEFKDGAFKVDPVYGSLTDLMAIAQSTVDDGAATIGTLKVQEDDVIALRANLVRGQAASWAGIYDAATQTLGMSSMLNAVKAKDLKTVEVFLATQGLKSWDVPIAYSGEIQQPDDLDLSNPTFRASEQDLTTAAEVNFATVRLVANDVTPSRASAADYSAGVELPKENREHTGAFNLGIEAAAQVLASDAGQAVRVLATILDIREQNASLFQNVLTVTPGIIQTVVMVPYVADTSDDSDSGYYDDDRYRG